MVAGLDAIIGSQDSSVTSSSSIRRGSEDGAAAETNESYWPPPCGLLTLFRVDVLSLHQLPKRGELRPRYDGTRGQCHKFVSELSGCSATPNDTDPSSPKITFKLHPIGGFCAVSVNWNRFPQNVEVEASTKTVQSNGMNAVFGDQMYCTAAEPHMTFLRLSVSDGGKEVAYETAVLGRLRRGYRVLQMRGLL
eukprot:6794283-Prymnesium_polylepis.1